MSVSAITLGPTPNFSPTPSALSLSVLVLNRSFVAVHVVNVRRAIRLLFRQLAEVVHAEAGQYAAYSLESWRELSNSGPSSAETMRAGSQESTTTGCERWATTCRHRV